jgi:cytosine/adenosine deaminase-related metal-dependent hydrolase
MTTLLARSADILVTMDAACREIKGGGFFARDGVIEVVDTNAELPESADEIIDLSGLIATPGLINTHHYFYQNLTRAVPAGQDATLFGWLQAHYPIWA